MAKKPMAFEDALSRLEENINRLENDDLTLDTALEYFENSLGLIRTCDAQLKKADGKLKELLKGENGELIEKVIGDNLTSVLGEEGINEQTERVRQKGSGSYRKDSR